MRYRFSAERRKALQTAISAGGNPFPPSPDTSNAKSTRAHPKTGGRTPPVAADLRISPFAVFSRVDAYDLWLSFETARIYSELTQAALLSHDYCQASSPSNQAPFEVFPRSGSQPIKPCEHQIHQQIYHKQSRTELRPRQGDRKVVRIAHIEARHALLYKLTGPYAKPRAISRGSLKTFNFAHASTGMPSSFDYRNMAFLRTR